MATSDFELTFIIISLFIFLVKLMHILARRLDMPDVLGELVLGFILGPSLLNIFFLSDNPSSSLDQVLHLTTEQLAITATIIKFISEFAVLLLLFKVGTEVNISELRKIKNKALNISIGGIVLPFLIGVIFTFVIANISGLIDLESGINTIEISMLIGLILSATSIGIALRIFLDMDIIKSKMSQTVVGAAVFDDILVVTLLGLMFSYYENNAGLDIGSVGLIVLEISLYFLISIVLFKYIFPRFKVFSHKFEDRAIPIFVSIAFMLIMSVLAQIMGLTPIIGAFVAGVIIGNEDDYLDVHTELDPISTWIIPFFFLSIGLQINARLLLSWNIILIAFALTLFAMLSKIVGGGVGAHLSGFNRDDSKIIGLAMAARGEVTLIFAAQAFALNYFNEAVYGIMILNVVITILVSVPLLKSQISSTMKKSAETAALKESDIAIAAGD